MPQIIKLKRSATEGNIPTTLQIELGEFAVNTTDGRVFTKQNDVSAAAPYHNGDAIIELAALNSGNDQIFTEDVVIQGTTGPQAELRTTNTDFNLLNTTATTVEAFGETTTLNVGSAASGSETTLRSEHTVFSSSDAIKIPVGTTAERVTSAVGDIRYNSELNTFEGFGPGNTWGSLGGVIDTNQDTYALAGVSGNTTLPHTGTNDTLTFVNNGVKTGEWNETLFDVNTNFNVDGNVTTTANTTLGNASADALTVNATSNFQADVFTNANTTLGDSSADALTVNATTNFTNDVFTNGNTTIGNAAADTLTVKATGTFEKQATFLEGIQVPAGAGISTFNDGAVFADSITVNTGETFTFDGQALTQLANFQVKNEGGTVIFSGFVFNP